MRYITRLNADDGLIILVGIKIFSQIGHMSESKLARRLDKFRFCCYEVSLSCNAD